MCASLNPVSPPLPLAGKFAFSRILQLDDLPFGSSLDTITILCYSVRRPMGGAARWGMPPVPFLLVVGGWFSRRPPSSSHAAPAALLHLPSTSLPQVGNTRQVPLLSVIPIAPIRRA